MQPMDWPAEPRRLSRQMDRLIGDDYSELQDARRHSLSRDRGGRDTRTHILHFKEHAAVLSSAFLGETKKNRNKIVCTCLLFCDSCLNKDGRKETGV
jgi:hypothetical protein